MRSLFLSTLLGTCTAALTAVAGVGLFYTLLRTASRVFS